MKTDVDKLDIGKVVPIPVDLSKLSNVAKSDVLKNAVYDKLVAKVNKIDTSEFVFKTKFDADKSKLENKISDTSRLVKKIYYNSKISELLDIHKYLMKKNGIVYNFWVCKANICFSNDMFWLQRIKCKFIKVCFNEQSRV